MNIAKMCANDPRSIELAETFDLEPYQLKELSHTRTLFVGPKEPTRNGRNGDLWLCSDEDFEGEPLHEYSSRRTANKYKPVQKPEE